MWIQVAFGNGQFEDAVLDFVHGLIGKQYPKFSQIRVKNHC
jgi:hypothetical protein